MVRQAIYAPHYDFFIEQCKKTDMHNMPSFHMHKKYEIYYLMEGSRKYFIDDSIHLVNPGNLVLVDTDSVHKTSNLGDAPHTRVVINFSKSFIEDFSEEIKALDLLSIFKTRHSVLPLSFKYKLTIESILSRLVSVNTTYVQELNSKSDSHYTLLKLLLSELLITIKDYIDELEKKQCESQPASNSKVTQILKYISLNYNKDLTLTSIAEQFYISPFYLSKIFKKSTNLSIVEYINSLRIRQAKELLEDSSYKIGYIAEHVGFSSSSHFSRTFKLVTGLSPQQYRKYYSNKSK